MTEPQSPLPILHGYFRSSAAYRVRIALNLKGIAVEHAFVHLRRGEQRGDAYRALNPTGLVPYWQEPGFGLGQKWRMAHVDGYTPCWIACRFEPLASLTQGVGS